VTHQEATSLAQRKARYGHRDWIVWKNKAGESFAERLTAESMKRCLLDKGTQGRWLLVCASRGDYVLGFWWMGLNLIRQCKRGWR
jgi:hypothetical protein